ncbi:hypothetical protein CEXT_323941 [Caerostris extrusa]|uniref:Uncharacterized protein n=1 Tax=Caerostris extrusa TaxID=172846 RepID=A0AAV4P9M0_CAEEX|nr:hypothetical protein CEXT_323941 [Caerostris extrusa]
MTHAFSVVLKFSVVNCYSRRLLPYPQTDFGNAPRFSSFCDDDSSLACEKEVAEEDRFYLYILGISLFLLTGSIFFSGLRPITRKAGGDGVVSADYLRSMTPIYVTRSGYSSRYRQLEVFLFTGIRIWS